MLILLAHGSRDPRWRGALEQMTLQLQAESCGQDIQLAYMQCTPPTLEDTLAIARRVGARRVRVLPLFLTRRGHVERTVCPMVAALQARFEDIAIELLAPLGEHASFLALLRAIAAGDTDARPAS
ncbi:MAG: cobalamin biosynthesis protein CbiX [Planctomycetes bacterium]|nr:cobalamin biosynthesis protein CbiX [Planctomycetota bacterium]